MGFITVFLSIRVGIRIHKKTQDVKGPARHLSPALSLQLAGEAIIGLGTLAFAIAQWTGVISDWSIELQSVIRFLMFFATSATTLHLSRTMDKIERGIK